MLGKTINAFHRKNYLDLIQVTDCHTTLVHRGNIYTHTHTHSFLTVFYIFQMMEYNALMFLSRYLVGKNDTHRRKIPRD